MLWIACPLFFFAGFVDSIAGGGGLISLTALLALGVPPHTALGTNKFAACIGTGTATIQFIHKRRIKWDAAITAFVGAAIGSAIGAELALHIDERLLSRIVLVVIPVVGIFLIFKRDFGATEKRLPQKILLPGSFLTGLVIGLYDGFVGPGTGTFLILAFTLFLGLNLATACGSAKLVNFSSNAAGMAAFVLAGAVDYRLAVPCALFNMAGNFLGARMALKQGAKIVRPMMIFVIVLLLAKVVWDLQQ